MLSCTVFMVLFLAGDALGYGIMAHRYFACKALAGLTQYPSAELEMRQYARCNDCTIFGACSSKAHIQDWVSRVHYQLSESETRLFPLVGAVCAASNTANYTPAGKQELALRHFSKQVDYPGDDIVTGSAEEDGGYILDIHSGRRIPRFMAHFWDPDLNSRGLDGGGLSLGIRPGKKLEGMLEKLHLPLICSEANQPTCEARESAYSHARSLWNHALELYRGGEKREAHYVLGRVVHLVSDMTVPAHVHGDTHGGWIAGAFVADACCTAPHAETDTDTLEKLVSRKRLLQSFDNIPVDPYKFEALPIDEAIWTQVADSSPDGLFKLFWFTAQKTQYWGSDGDLNPSPPIKVTGARCEPPNFLADTNRICIDYAPQSPGAFFTKDGATAGELPENLWPQNETPIHRPCQVRKTNKKSKEMMSRAIARHTLASVSGLYRLFWDQTHDNDGDGYGILTDCDDNDESIFPGGTTTCGYGPCAVTVANCENGTLVPCTPLDPPEPGKETSCDNLDNNCDNNIDEDISQPCYTGAPETEGVGICHGGTSTCVAGSFGSCEGEVTPLPEICGDDLDNDCNGEADEGCSQVPFTNDNINHDPRCKLPNGSSQRGIPCVEHASCPDGIGGVHEGPDIHVPVRPATRLSSTSTIITVTPNAGFSGSIRFSINRVEKDDDKDNCGDGSPISIHGIRYFFFEKGSDKGVENEITIGPPYEFKFIVNVFPEIEQSRYIIYLEAKAVDDSSPSVIEPILMTISDKKGGFEEI